MERGAPMCIISSFNLLKIIRIACNKMHQDGDTEQESHRFTWPVATVSNKNILIGRDVARISVRGV